MMCTIACVFRNGPYLLEVLKPRVRINVVRLRDTLMPHGAQKTLYHRTPHALLCPSKPRDLRGAVTRGAVSRCGSRRPDFHTRLRERDATTRKTLNANEMERTITQTP